MKKQHTGLKSIVVMILYIVALTAINYTRDFSLWNFCGDLLAVFLLLIMLFIILISKKTRTKKKVLSATVIIFSFICIPLCFFINNEFEGHRLLMFTPAILLLAVVLRGNARVNVLCSTIIYYILCATAAVSLPLFIEVDFVEPIFSVQLWTFAITLVLNIFIIFIHAGGHNKHHSVVAENTFYEQLKEAGDDGMYVCFTVVDHEDIRKKIGNIEYHILYSELEQFLQKFRDEDTFVYPYGGTSFLFIIKDKSMEYVNDFAEGISLSVQDEIGKSYEIALSYNIHEKLSDEDIVSAAKAVDRSI